VDNRAYAYVSKDNKVLATIRYIGLTQFAPGIWIGVEIDSPIIKNNCSVQSIVYFTCRMNYGLFLREENVISIAAAHALDNYLPYTIY
jgi:dynactin complex subunit